MKASEIFKVAAAYLSQSVEDSDDLEPFVLPWLNVLLQECIETENALRRFDGTEELPSAPMLEALSDDVPYHDTLVRTALPYGLAADFCRDDDNDYRQQSFRAMYVNAVNDAQRVNSEKIADVYENV